MNAMASKFGERLQQAIAASSKTPYRVAKDAGISTPQLYRLLSGDRPPTEDVMVKLAPVLGLPLAKLKAWARAEGLDEEEQRYLWQDAASPLVRMEAAGREIDRLTAEMDQLMKQEPTPEVIARGNTINALLVALEGYLDEEGAKLEAEKRRRESGKE